MAVTQSPPGTVDYFGAVISSVGDSHSSVGYGSADTAFHRHYSAFGGYSGNPLTVISYSSGNSGHMSSVESGRVQSVAVVGRIVVISDEVPSSDIVYEPVIVIIDSVVGDFIGINPDIRR